MRAWCDRLAGNVAAFAGLLLAVGCATAPPEPPPQPQAPPLPVYRIPDAHFRGFTAGMFRIEVDQSLGAAIREVGTKDCEPGTVVILEYAVTPGGGPAAGTTPQTFFLYFREGRLAHWDRPGEDWEAEAKQACEGTAP